MTESDWLRCECPERLLASLCTDGEPPDLRKLRLFACACCRRIKGQIGADCWRLIEAYERQAGSAGIPPEVRAAAAKFDRERRSYPFQSHSTGARVVGWLSSADLYRALPDLLCLARASERAARNAAGGQWSAGPDPRTIQADLLRCVFGDPPAEAAFDPTWRTPDVRAIAQMVRDEQAFGHLPILGDALEDAGATHECLLRHCRQDAHHARGCWAVGLTLGEL
jgi:hypothetical protein